MSGSSWYNSTARPSELLPLDLNNHRKNKVNYCPFCKVVEICFILNLWAFSWASERQAMHLTCSNKQGASWKIFVCFIIQTVISLSSWGGIYTPRYWLVLQRNNSVFPCLLFINTHPCSRINPAWLYYKLHPCWSSYRILLSRWCEQTSLRDCE